MPQPSVPRSERRTLAMKVESTYGVDAFGGTVAAADIQEVYNIEVASGPQMQEVPFIGGFLGSLGTVPGVRIAQVTFEQMARGAGSAYSASVVPNVHLPFRGCGMLATGTFTPGAEKWEYTPRSSSMEAVTIYVMQENAPTMMLLGAFGDMQVIGAVGRWLQVRYVFTGIYKQEADTPALVTKQFSPSPQWPVVLSAAFQIGSENYAPNIQAVQINLNNTIDVQEAINAASGVAGVFIASRRPNGALDPEMATRATFDWISKWENSTVMDLSFQSAGAQYARWKFSADKATIRTRGWGRRGQKATYQVGFDLIPTNGDDEFKWTFD